MPRLGGRGPKRRYVRSRDATFAVVFASLFRDICAYGFARAIESVERNH